MSGRSGSRLAASAAFLAALTVAVLIVRSGFSGEEAQPAATTTAETAPATTAAQTQTQPQTAPATTQAATTAQADPEFYEIKAGDTLEVVAAQEDTTVERLLILNPDVDPVALTIGQRIRVR